MPTTPPYPRVLRWLLAGGLLVWLAGMYWPWSVDDVYITVGYARQWAETGALTWTDGVRVEGYSNFLLVALLAAGMRLGLDGAWLAQSLALLSGLSILALASWRFPVSRAGTLAIVGLAVWSPLCRWSVTGMETIFYSLLLSVGWLIMTAERRLWGWGVWLLILAAMTRPEAAGYVGLALGTRLLGPRRLTPQDGIALAGLLAFGAYHAIRVQWFDALLPTPVLVKVGGQPWTWHGIVQVGSELLTAAGLLLAVCLATRPRGWRFFLALVPLLAQAAVLIRAGGDWMVYARLLLPGVIATGIVLGSLPTPRSIPTPRKGLLALAVVGVLLGGLVEPTGYGHLVWEKRSISQALKGGFTYFRGMDTPLAEDVAWAANHLPEGSEFLAIDAGMLGSIPETRLIDMRGLVYRPMAVAIGSRDAEGGLKQARSTTHPDALLRIASWGGDFPTLPEWLVEDPEDHTPIYYGGGEIRWFPVTPAPASDEVRYARWQALLEDFPHHPFLHWQAALAMVDIGRQEEGLSILTAANQRWPRDARFQGGLACIGFVRGSHPLNCEGERGLELLPGATLVAAPGAEGRAEVWMEDSEASASFRISSSCRADQDAVVQHGDTGPFPPCDASRVTVSRLDDDASIRLWIRLRSD